MGIFEAFRGITKRSDTSSPRRSGLERYLLSYISCYGRCNLHQRSCVLFVIVRLNAQIDLVRGLISMHATDERELSLYLLNQHSDVAKQQITLETGCV